jgi:hypothetical protein
MGESSKDISVLVVIEGFCIDIGRPRGLGDDLDSVTSEESDSESESSSEPLELANRIRGKLALCDRRVEKSSKSARKMSPESSSVDVGGSDVLASSSSSIGYALLVVSSLTGVSK